MSLDVVWIEGDGFLQWLDGGLRIIAGEFALSQPKEGFFVCRVGGNGGLEIGQRGAGVVLFQEYFTEKTVGDGVVG